MSHNSDVPWASWCLNYRQVDSSFTSLFMLTTKKHQIFALLAHCEGDHRWQVVSPHKWSVMRKAFSCHDAIMKCYRFTDVISNIIGHRETELALQLGRLFSPEEAERIKLVDDVAPMDQIMTRAQAEMDRWLQIPGIYRWVSVRKT